MLGWVFVAIVAFAALAPALAGARAVADDWVPVGDDAAIAVLADDVFSGDSPLVGVRTTLGGTDSEYNARHLGPLEFWALALPVRLSGGAPWGLVLGTVLVGIISILAVVWAAQRIGGTGAAVWAAALTAVGCWSLGRQLLADPWNPYIALLPILAALFLAWAAGAGEAWALPPLAFAVSFAAQAHLLYAPLALVLFAGAVVAVVVTRPAVRELVATAAVLAVSWLFPAWEQIRHDPGNLVELSRNFRDDQQVGVGWEYALRATARAIGVVPLFGRSGGDLGHFGAPLSILTMLSAIAVVVALLGGTMYAIIRRDRPAASAGVVAFVAIAAVVTTTAQVPRAFPDLPFYRLLQLWPAGIFTWFALGFMVVRLFSLPGLARRIGIAFGVVLLVVAAPSTAFSDSAFPEDERYGEAVLAVARAVEPELDDIGPVRIRATGEAYGQILYGLVAELRDRGVDARVDRGDEYLSETHSGPADSPVLLVVGGSSPIPEGGRAVATYEAVTGADADLLAEMDAEIRELLTATGVPEFQGRDPYHLYRDATLLRLEIDGAWDPTDEQKALIERYRRLRFVAEELHLTAYLLPGG